MAGVDSWNIVCGVDFMGQNVNCYSTNPPLQTTLVPLINRFVNRLLLESLDGRRVTPAKVIKLKKGIFFLSSSSQYYDLFFDYMTQTAPANITVAGVPTPVFNVNYLPDVPTGNIIQGNIDLRVVRLYVSFISYHMAALMGWLRDPIGDIHGNLLSPGSTLQGVYQSVLPDNAKIPQNVQDACIGQLGNTIQKIYFTRGVLFFSIGGDYDERPGYITNYRANIETQNPPIPSGQIVWNNPDSLASTQIFISTFDKNDFDTELILQSTNVIRIRSVLTTEFQNWQVTGQPTVVPDQYVQFTVTLTDGTWHPQQDEECRVFLMSRGQTVPTYRDELTSEIKQFTTNVGGRKKRQNKSKRRKQKVSNKKSRFLKRRHYSRRS